MKTALTYDLLLFTYFEPLSLDFSLKRRNFQLKDYLHEHSTARYRRRF